MGYIPMIDSSIYQGIKPLQIESQTNNLANMLNLQGLQQSGQLNALKMQEAQRGVEQQNSLRSILSGVQPTDKPDAIAQRLMQGGHLKEASEYQKNNRENQKNEAATAKDMADVVTKRTEWYKNQLSNVKTPQDAAGWVQAQYKDQYLSPLFSSMGSAEDSIRSIPQDPTEFNGWIQKQALNMGKFIELNKPSYHTQNLGNISQIVATPGLGGASNVVSSSAINQSPDNAATIANAAELARLSRAQSASQHAQTQASSQVVYDPERGVLVNKATGASKAAILPNGEPIEPKEKPLTEGQAKAILFGSRMQNSHNIIADLAKSGTNASLPFSRTGGGVGSVINAASGENQQSLDQAKRDFVNATLRRESGASISPSEFSNAELQYFPQIGDSPKVIAQKEANRATAIRGMKAEVPKASQGKFNEVEGNNMSPTKANAAAFDAAKEERYQAWLKSQGGAK